MDGGTSRLGARRLATIGAVLAVVIAVAGIGVVLSRPHTHRDARDTLRVVNSLPSDSATPESSATPSATPTEKPSPSETPTPEATTSDPSSGGGGGTSTSSDPAMMSDLGPVPPGSVVFGYQSGRQDWSGTSNGIRMSVHMAPASPHAGQTVTFDVHASASAHCCYAYMVFGNGRGTPDVHCMQGPAGSDYSVEYSTIYNQAGRYEFLAGAMSGSSCRNQGDIYAYIDIGPGTSTGQGPDLPVVKVDSSTPAPGHEGDPSYVTLWGQGTDDDGFVRRIVVDWGDGTSTTFPGEGDCQRGSDGWPAPSEADVPYDPPPVHHYKSHGDFRITLTAVSTACDGSDIQHGHASMTWSNPAPPKPSPSPSPSQTASP